MRPIERNYLSKCQQSKEVKSRSVKLIGRGGIDMCDISESIILLGMYVYDEYADAGMYRYNLPSSSI